MRKTFTLFLSLLLSITSFSVMAQLSPGDIAFTMINRSNNTYSNGETGDMFAFVALVDIANGTEISFTDRGWTGTELLPENGTETSFTLTTVALEAGEQVIIYTDNLGGKTPSAFKYSDGTSAGTISKLYAGDMSFAGSGDQVLAYVGNLNFIAGLHSYDDVFSNTPQDATTKWSAVASGISSYQSLLPSQLTNGSTAISLFPAGEEEQDNARYAGSLNSGSKEELLAAINNVSNWEFQPSDVFTAPAGTFSVTASCSLTASITSQTNIACNGESTGSLTVTASSGNANYSYNWSNGATTDNSSSATNTISNLEANSYTVTITDGNGCEAVASSTITEPVTLSASAVVDSNVTCNGLNDGGATASATGGTGSYSYEWDNSLTGVSLNGVSAGTYEVTVTDDNGCTANASVTITEPALFTATATVDSNVACNGASDGGATVSVSGGTAPYSYTWNNTATTASITGLSAGTYDVTVTDNNGCTANASASVTEPTALSASTVVDSNATCNGASDGGATVSVTGGTAPYSYAWNNTASTATIAGVPAGIYSVIVTDDMGCEAQAEVTITEPSSLIATAVVDSNATCNGASDGGVTASVSGGTAPYVYVWSNTATTASVTGLSAGTYDVTVTDNNGCTAMASASVTEPASFTATATVDSNATCNGASDGGATTTIAGGTAPYSYAWNNTANTATIAGVPAGIYSVIVTDDMGCEAQAEVTITEPAALIAQAVVDSNVTCPGASDGGVTVAVTGGNIPYTYEWNNTATTASITGITAGVYSVIVTDDMGCETTAQTTVTEPDELEIEGVVTKESETDASDGMIDITIYGGTAPFSYDWDNDGTGDYDDTEDLESLSDGDYMLMVMDNNGCQVSESFTVTTNTVTALSSFNNTGRLNYYPNPVSKLLNIELGDTYKDLQVNIRNSYGHLISSKNIESAERIELNIDEEAGIYFVEILVSGNKHSAFRVLKK